MSDYTRPDNDYYQYIFNRTISISQIGDGNASGTAWIFKRISGYQYYAFTNIHVKNAIEKCKNDASWYESETAVYATNADINDTNPRTPSNYPLGSYYSYSDYQWMWSVGSGTTAANNSRVADFCVVKLNFGSSPTNSSGLKNRLDSLNSEFGGNRMVKFRPSPVPQSKFSSTYFYGGGYPFAYDNDSTTHYTKRKTTISKIVTSSHGQNVNTNCSVYEMTSNGFIFGGGASGSMVIDRWAQVVGIYWGGWYTSTEWWGGVDIVKYDGVYDCVAQCQYF